MYLGRYIGVGQTHDGHNSMFYRLASQSCRGREIVGGWDELRVVAKKGFEAEVAKNRFLTYTALIRLNDYIVIGNYDHTKSIVQHLLRHWDPYRALGTVLADLGPEEDEAKTPRLAGILPALGNQAWIGIAGEHATHIEAVKLRAGGWYFAASEFRDRQYISEAFHPVSLQDLPKFALGRDQSTMSTIIITQSKTGNGFEVDVNNC